MTDIKQYIPLHAAYEQTREVWSEFDADQRRAVVLASTATFGRIVLRLGVEYATDREILSRRQAAIAHGVLDLADTVDGRIARAGNAVTPWGKVADPFADKIDFAIQDISRVRREEMPRAVALLRVSRDIASTALRQYESAHPTNGISRTSATWAGKASTTARSISNRITDIAPRTRVAQFAQPASTAALLASLYANARDFRRNRRSS